MDCFYTFHWVFEPLLRGVKERLTNELCGRIRDRGRKFMCGVFWEFTSNSIHVHQHYSSRSRLFAELWFSTTEDVLCDSATSDYATVSCLPCQSLVSHLVPSFP